MIIKAQNDLTTISDNKKINAENYMDSLNYVSNLYIFINKIKLGISLNKVQFLPSFKGRCVAEKLGIKSTKDENEMRVFKVRSNLFLEEDIYKKVRENLADMCESIVRIDDIAIFTLKQ